MHNNVSHICRPTKNPILSTCRGTLCSIILPVAECIITVVLAQQYTGFMEMILSSCFGTELSYRYTQYPIPGYAHHKLKKKSTPHNSHLPLPHHRQSHFTISHTICFDAFSTPHLSRHLCTQGPIPQCTNFERVPGVDGRLGLCRPSRYRLATRCCLNFVVDHC